MIETWGQRAASSSSESRDEQLRTEELSADKLQKFERTNLFLEKPEQKCPILKEKPCLASFSPAEHEVFAYFQ